MNEQKIAVIGCGVWGRNIVRNFYNLNVLDIVCDLDESNLQKVTEQYSGVKVTRDFHDIINNPEITGVCVVTPSHTHYKMVKAMLEAGKNVYVEKPISTVADEARDLSQLAHEKGLVLMVGHLLLYHPAVNRLKMLIEEGALGEIVYVQSDRLNVNYFKNDRSVMWDLAPHDVSMISYATVTALTAKSITSAYERFIYPDIDIKEVIIGGGGAYNPTLMKYLRHYLPKHIDLKTHEAYGISNNFKEAMAFALLGYCNYYNIPSNLPSCTGAKKRVVLGKLTNCI